LLAEVSREHPLSGARVMAIARCEGCDEVVFSVETDLAQGPGAAAMAPNRGSADAAVAQPCQA
jgi:hypothetical protein